MKKTIVEIEDQDGINAVLCQFKDTLTSLQRGKEYRKSMAIKLATYGNVICLNNSNNIEAFAAFYCNDKIKKTAYLSMIAVSLECRGQGLGSVLLKIVENYSINKKMEKMKLEVAKNNINAIRFYESNGYKKVEEKTDTYYYQKNLTCYLK